MTQDESKFLVLKELHERIKTDPEKAGWYMYKAYRLGEGCSVDEALEFAPDNKPILKIVKI